VTPITKPSTWAWFRITIPNPGPHTGLGDIMRLIRSMMWQYHIPNRRRRIIPIAPGQRDVIWELHATRNVLEFLGEELEAEFPGGVVRVEDLGDAPVPWELRLWRRRRPR
jgi:hypothetical protein